MTEDEANQVIDGFLAEEDALEVAARNWRRKENVPRTIGDLTTRNASGDRVKVASVYMWKVETAEDVA